MAEFDIRLDQYEGPLDLLLALIGKHKIDIFDIPIASLADQYVAYIEAMQENDMEVTSDFIYMASELMLIKSRMLLPRQEDEEDPRQQLVDALVEHQKARIAADFLRQQSELYYDRFPKEPDPGDGIYYRAHAVTLLQEAFGRLNGRMTAIEPEEVALFEQIENERFYTVEEKILALLRLLYDEKERPFLYLFLGTHGRSEIIAVFMALLELVKNGRIAVIRREGELYLQLNRGKQERQ